MRKLFSDQRGGFADVVTELFQHLRPMAHAEADLTARPNVAAFLHPLGPHFASAAAVLIESHTSVLSAVSCAAAMALSKYSFVFA